MTITSEHNQSAHTLQDVLEGEKLSRRQAFRIWSLTSKGMTLVQLGEILGVTATAVGIMLNNDRMPVDHHKALVAAGVPESLLPRPEDATRGAKPRVKPQ